MAYTIPEAEALEENLDSKFSMIQAMSKEEILVRRIHPDAKIPTKGFKDPEGMTYTSMKIRQS